MPQRTMRIRLTRHALLITALLAAGACATNPVTGQREFSLMSESQEIQVGKELDGEVRREMGIYEDRGLQEYVEQTGLRLARSSHRPNLPWHFAVVDVAAVNAFALPGGYIYLTRGILSHLNDESELAGVLGHEIGHVTARHAAQAYTRATGAQLGLILGGIFVPATQPFGDLASTGLGLLFLKYGRDDELQADRLGAEYAARTGWDPGGVPHLLTTLARIDEASDRQGIPNWLSTHPQPEDRVAKIQSTVAQLKTQANGDFATSKESFLRRIDGMVFGENPREGVVRGATFLHPDLRFALRFPEGWEVTNSQTQVVAKQPGQELYVVLQLVEDPRGGGIEDVAGNAMRNAGYRRVEGGRTEINGLDAYVGTYEGQMQGLGRVRTRAAHIAHGRNVFVLAGLAPVDLFGRAERDFTESIRSFRALSAAEADAIRPNRIDLYVVREGDTWQGIAQRQGEANVNASALAIMNGYAPNAQPQPGDRVKIVVGG